MCRCVHQIDVVVSNGGRGESNGGGVFVMSMRVMSVFFSSCVMFALNRNLWERRGTYMLRDSCVCCNGTFEPMIKALSIVENKNR